MEPQWYIMSVVVGRENGAKRDILARAESLNMMEKIKEIIIPEHDEVEIKQGSKSVKKRNMYPGYVLVKTVMEDSVWRMLRNTPAVTGFVTASDADNYRRTPVPLEQEEVDKIVNLMKSEEPTTNFGYVAGDTVRIINGPFRDFMGIIEDVDQEHGKVKVQVTFLGKETPVELDFSHVEADN